MSELKNIIHYFLFLGTVLIKQKMHYFQNLIVLFYKEFKNYKNYSAIYQAFILTLKNIQCLFIV